MFIEVCVVIPVPDTDCQGLENQFLRRSGWQVASREQSMLKEREKFVIKNRTDSRTEKVECVKKLKKCACKSLISQTVSSNVSTFLVDLVLKSNR